MTLDFTSEKYEELLQVLLDQDLKIFTVLSYLKKRPKSNFVILRHDVDRKPVNAFRMAELENGIGVESTYYFRSVKGAFKPEIIRRIHALGHEVGYHYEVLSKTKGDYEEALKIFESQLNDFRKICDIETICMHGSPLSRYDNRDLWKRCDFEQFGILGEAYLSVQDVNYFSDTGRTWSSRNKIRDFIRGDDPSANRFALNNTDDVLNLVKSKELNSLYLVTHPERWSSNRLDWIWCYFRDMTFNMGKRVFIRFS